ncbi:MAG TPA: S8 family serine peptidase, partial [Candidatus Baltobacteraceae bacterium]|nr:S8 family serine peptidase [Candidatus Baltobacteraceae bacterium]
LAITEEIAPYSNYIVGSNGRYLLAPGGNATSSNDSDDLHWIEGLYSSTALHSAQYCVPDLGAAPGSTNDCRLLFVGTSQATPHVAGVAAMILTVRPNYTPQQVATAMCASAVDIGNLKEGCGRLDANGAVAYALAH